MWHHNSVVSIYLPSLLTTFFCSPWLLRAVWTETCSLTSVWVSVWQTDVGLRAHLSRPTIAAQLGRLIGPLALSPYRCTGGKLSYSWKYIRLGNGVDCTRKRSRHFAGSNFLCGRNISHVGVARVIAQMLSLRYLNGDVVTWCCSFQIKILLEQSDIHNVLNDHELIHIFNGWCSVSEVFSCLTKSF